MAHATSKKNDQQERDREDRRLVHVPAEPTMPDEVGEETPRIDRMSGIREETRKSDDASGMPANDERRGEQRKRRYEEGASEVSSLD
jgi:hypothetical protein